MKIYEVGTGYTSIPATMGAATEIVVEELTKSFQKQGRNVTIIDIEATNRIQNALPIIEVPVPKIFTGIDVKLGVMHKLKRIVYSISLAYTLKKKAFEAKDNIVIHFHNQYNMFFFLMLSSKKIREKCFIAYTNHSYVWHGEWEEIKAVIHKRYFQEVKSMKNADRVYVLNAHTMETLRAYVGIPKQKIQLIDNGVNTDIYYPQDKADIEAFKGELGVDKKMVYLQIGSVCDRKNQLGAIQMLLPLLKEYKEAVFVYAGGIISEEYQQHIIEFVKKNRIENQVLYMGELTPGKELNRYYNMAEAMVFPSKSEGFSLVIIEAMAAGVPVIIHENLQFKLADECLKYSDEADFLAVMHSKILNKEQQNKISERVRTAVLKNYSWDKIAEDYFESWN